MATATVDGVELVLAASGDGSVRAWRVDGTPACPPFTFAVTFDFLSLFRSNRSHNASQLGVDKSANYLRAVAIDATSGVVVVVAQTGAAFALRLARRGDAFVWRNLANSADVSEGVATTTTTSDKVQPFAHNAAAAAFGGDGALWCVGDDVAKFALRDGAMKASDDGAWLGAVASRDASADAVTMNRGYADVAQLRKNFHDEDGDNDGDDGDGDGDGDGGAGGGGGGDEAKREHPRGALAKKKQRKT